MTEYEWLLTSEEIRDVFEGDQRNYATNGSGELKILSLVQDAKTKRKLTEWIALMGDYSQGSSENAFTIPKDKWEALCKEFGL